MLFVCLFKKFKTKEIHNRNIIGKKGRSIFTSIIFLWLVFCLFVFKGEGRQRREVGKGEEGILFLQYYY